MRLELAKPKASIGVLVSYPKSGRTWLRVMLNELHLVFNYIDDGVVEWEQPFEDLVLCQQDLYRDKPVVFLSRDPRDTVVSCFFQKSLRLDGYAGGISIIGRCRLRAR